MGYALHRNFQILPRVLSSFDELACVFLIAPGFRIYLVSASIYRGLASGGRRSKEPGPDPSA